MLAWDQRATPSGRPDKSDGLLEIPSSAASATAAATARASSAAPAATAAAEGSGSTAATRTLGPLTGFVDGHLAPPKVFAVGRLDGRLHVFAGLELHEGEPSRLTAESIPDKLDLFGLHTAFREEILKI